MGQGISGAIPLDFYFDDEYKRNDYQKASPRFLDFYRETERQERGIYYTLNYPDFLPVFKDFYFGLHDIFEDNYRGKSEKFDDEYDRIVQNNDLDAFCRHFKESGFYDPSIQESFPGSPITGFSVRGFITWRYLVVYSGSYKAFLEEYTTLVDMERLLKRAYNHPLSCITKFGIFG